MPQSSLILFYLIAGFIVYIVSKGELPTYLGFLTGGTSKSGSAASSVTGVLGSVAGLSGNSGPIDSGSFDSGQPLTTLYQSNGMFSGYAQPGYETLGE